MPVLFEPALCKLPFFLRFAIIRSTCLDESPTLRAILEAVSFGCSFIYSKIALLCFSFILPSSPPFIPTFLASYFDFLFWLSV